MKNRKSIITLLSFLSVLIIGSNVSALQWTMFDWNAGDGHTMPGWTWHQNVTFASATAKVGWSKDGGPAYPWGYGQASFAQNGYGGIVDATIQGLDCAPHLIGSKCLKIFDTGASTENIATWWLWYNGVNIGETSGGAVNATTDRMDFYMKVTGTTPINDNGVEAAVTFYNFHIGTYLCWDNLDANGKPITSYGQGGGCPYEGPQNQHYYHYLTINPDTWIHVVLDNHPTKRRNGWVVGNNPSNILSGKNYMQHISRIYLDQRRLEPQPTAIFIDDINLYSTADTVEPNQNDDSITSLWVGYWAGTDNWEIGWNDMYQQDINGVTMNSTTWSTFEIRYSASPITNANYASATLIEPMIYGTDTTKLRRHAPDSRVSWTRFKLPDAVETSNNVIYFAVKDVSVAGRTYSSGYKFNKADGKNAPSDLVHLIDYSFTTSTIPTGVKAK